MEGRDGDKNEGEGRFYEKLLVYRPAWCLDEEITCSGKRALDKITLLSFLCYRSLFQPGVISIPIHLVWVTRATGEPCRPLKPLLTQRRRGRVGCEVTGTSLLQSFLALVVEERDRGHNRTIRLSQSSLRAFRGKAIAVFPKHRLYLGGLPRYINSCQSIFRTDRFRILLFSL